jgi:hypothetical protein
MIRFFNPFYSLVFLSSNNSKPIEFKFFLITFAFDCRLNQLRFPLLNRKNREPHFFQFRRHFHNDHKPYVFDIEFHFIIFCFRDE